MSWDFPERKKGGKAHISEAQKRYAEIEGAEDGRSLMMKNILLKQEPEAENDSGGYWWPSAYSTWTHTIVSFSFSVSLTVAQFTIPR
jgi:hypothetical protein